MCIKFEILQQERDTTWEKSDLESRIFAMIRLQQQEAKELKNMFVVQARSFISDNLTENFLRSFNFFFQLDAPIFWKLVTKYYEREVPHTKTIERSFEQKCKTPTKTKMFLVFSFIIFFGGFNDRVEKQPDKEEIDSKTSRRAASQKNKKSNLFPIHYQSRYVLF